MKFEIRSRWDSKASDPTLEKVPEFYCSNEEALADMKRLAEAEAAAVTP